MNFIRRITGRDSKEVVRVLRLAGQIRSTPSDEMGFRPPRYLSIFNLEKRIESAFDCKKVKPKAVVLEINSPGGSAVQSSLIFTRIRNLAAKNNVPLISFTEDLAASGGYWLACAADELYADPNSMIGSIGALYAGFGFEETIKKLGLEWRLVTAGENKMRLDPFKPMQEKDKVWITNIINETHSGFIDVVKSRRKSLDLNHKTVFSGDVFSGKEALTIGLIDGVESDLNALIKRKYGESVKIERISAPRAGFLSMFRARTGSLVDVHEAMDGVMERGLYSKYGL